MILNRFFSTYSMAIYHSFAMDQAALGFVLRAWEAVEAGEVVLTVVGISWMDKEVSRWEDVGMGGWIGGGLGCIFPGALPVDWREMDRIWWSLGDRTDRIWYERVGKNKD
jgi:hypothetical protein